MIKRPDQNQPPTDGLERLTKRLSDSLPPGVSKHMLLSPAAIRRSLISSLIFLLMTAALFAWMSSASFERMVRARVVEELENLVGGRIEIASIHWNPMRLEVDAEGIVIHGLEPPTEAPYARIKALHVAVSIRGMLWSPAVLLRDLEVRQPEIHLIVHEDGSTNQPQPRRKIQSSRSTLDTLFRLEASRFVVSNGVFRLNDHRTELNLDARTVSLALGYRPSARNVAESYHLVVAASNLDLARGLNVDQSKAHAHAPTADFRIETTLDFTRTAAYMRSLRVISQSHQLDVVGSLQNFSQPVWQAQVKGEFQLALLQPLVGFQDIPRGVARMDLKAAGTNGSFHVDGLVHATDAAYSIPGVEASGLMLDARVHADAKVLDVSAVRILFPHGGTMTGELFLNHWLPPPSTAPPVDAAHGYSLSPRPALADPNLITIPVDGKITAQMNALAVDSILEVVTAPKFHRLGLDSLASGPIEAKWLRGDVRTLTVNAKLALAPSSHPLSGEVPAVGLVDGTYTQANGAVTLRTLDVQLPASRIQAHGRLGAYPISSATGITVDFASSNLGEFDAILKSLDFQLNKQHGAAALPVRLSGQSTFTGTWAGSLLDPHLSGNLQASNLSIQMPARSNDPSATPQWIDWDTVAIAGSYSATHVALDSVRLTHGKGEIDLGGTLDAVTGPFPPRGLPAPDFDRDSLLHLRAKVRAIPLDELYAFTGQAVPVTGNLAADFQISGPMHSLAGTGWAELTSATAYGEPIARAHADASIAGSQVTFTHLAVNAPSGELTASGAFDLKTRRFNVDARASALQIARINAVRNKMPQVTGSLTFHATGSGSLSDPVLEAHANLSGLSFAGSIAQSPFKTIVPGNVELTAHTANRTLFYDATAHMQEGEVRAQGQTQLNEPNQTQAQIHIAHFNLGSLPSSPGFQRLNSETAIDGVIAIEGPLAHMDQLRGDARLSTVNATIQGVRLSSQGTVHAAFNHSRITLDPVHITGEGTDVHAQGDLMVNGAYALNLIANGSINLKLIETLDRDITASGISTFQVEAHGTIANPDLRGTIEMQNGAIALGDIPNGLTQIRGTLQFNQNRLEARSLTAMTGGGLLTLTGYLAYQKELYADLSVTGNAIRIRYPQGVSSVADATLHLQGSQTNMLLSGNVLINRFTLNPDLDMASLANQAKSVRPVVPIDAPSNHWRLDVHVLSSPQLNFQNAFAKLAGNVDLRLRGTVASPVLLGHISITEGSTTIAGTHYSMDRGEITFNNPVRIQPNLDLNATAHVQDYDITLGVHGPMDHPSISYRSEPPLPESDVIALLALGHTQDQQRLYTQQQVTANNTTDTLLGGALNATVSSRVQKLFGAGSVKVDPSYLGAQGNSTSRITVEEQVGKAVTLTFATNANSTAQQLIQAEIAVNRHISLLVARDESGVFSMVLKATRRYR